MKRRALKLATIKILYGRSGDECAHPQCTSSLIAPKTDESAATAVNHICHIYARSEDGPRGKHGLTDEQIDSYDNLILLCAHHHAIVDKQHETYPAALLKQWKQDHEEKVQRRKEKVPESMLRQPLPAGLTAFIDNQIEADIDRFRKKLAFKEPDEINGDPEAIDTALSLARKLTEGDYSDGSDSVRMVGLAWCVRVLAAKGKLDDAERYLDDSASIGSCPESKVARAITLARKGHKKDALRKLADIETPASRSAGFMVVEHHDGWQHAIEWLDASNIRSADLDHDGKLLLLGRQLEHGRWDDAFTCLETITDDNLRDAPALHFFVGMTNLMKLVPEELRDVVFQYLPNGGAGFPLDSKGDAPINLRAAHQHFAQAADAARRLDCSEAAAIADEYALWLGLRHPDLKTDARRRLMELLHKPSCRLRFVSLGVQFGFDLDFPAVERQIEQAIALNSGATYDTAAARFAIATAQKTPKGFLEYLSRYRDEMTDLIDDRALRMIEIEMLARAGRSNEARERLSQLISAKGTSRADLDRLQGCIAESDGADPVDIRRKRFDETNDIRDLSQLIGGLESAKRWHDVCLYGEVLFERTKSIEDAERLAFAFHETGSDERLSTFLTSNMDMVETSERLKVLRCSALYNDGRLVNALNELTALSSERLDAIYGPIYRALQINVRVAIGDWNGVSTIVAEEYQRRSERNAEELIELAEIACCLSSPNARELAFAAAEKGNQDPAILNRGYILAVKYGWENQEETGKWLRDAVSLSDDDGHVRKTSLKEIMSLRQSWDRRAAETSRLLSSGEIPMFVAGQLMKRSLGSLILGGSYSNHDERDPRRRSVIPAYSENRRPIAADINETMTVAVDGAALFTLSLLDMLEEFLNSWSRVHIAHTTLWRLLREKQLSVFHQRRIVDEAQKLQQLLATGVLAMMPPSAVPSSDLCGQIGEDLARMITEAEKSRKDDGPQPLVVRSAPVHRLSSLMNEEADLTEHSGVLVSCGAVVMMLRTKGVITAKEQKIASDYLSLHERPWASEPDIVDGATLYFDDLSISYFMHLGILHKLEASGHPVMVARRSVSEANHLLSHQNVLAKISDAIERIRSALHSGITAGRVVVGKRIVNQGTAAESTTSHSTIEVIGLADVCDAIVVDDRFVNRHLHIARGAAQPVFNTPVLSTLDIVDVLVRRNAISAEDRLNHRDLLRRSGYIFVPVEGDELIAHLGASTVKDGKVEETAELRAIRENILSVRMGHWLRSGDAMPWLLALFDVLKGALRKLWNSGDELSNVQARSDWIWNQMDIRGWAHVFDLRKAGVIDDLYLMVVVELMVPVTDHENKMREYHRWLEDRMLISIREQNSELFSRIVDWHRQTIAEVANADREAYEGSGE